MGAIPGNILGLLLIIGSALLGFVSFQLAAIAFVVIAYGTWLMIALLNKATDPGKSHPMYGSVAMPQEQIDVYRHFHISIWFPGAAEVCSALLNLLRLACVVWGILCVIYQFYWLAAPMFAYFFVTSGLIVKMAPMRYVLDGARDGNEFAQSQMQLIQLISEKREVFNRLGDMDETHE